MAPEHLNMANAAIIAWMGHELCWAEQDVDVRDLKIESHRKIPLGSFMTDIFTKKDRDSTSQKTKSN